MAQNWAIAIGINNYEFMQPLSYAQRDAETVAEFLRQEAHFNEVFLFTTDSPRINGKSTFPFRTNLLRMMREIFDQPRMSSGDNFWFFFSGYGMRHEGRDYLMPLDGDPEDPENSAIPTHVITDYLRECGADNVVMILDACRNQRKKSGEGIGRETEAVARQTGVISIFSCSPHEYSYEIPALGQGAFTAALLDGLGGHGRCATVERLNRYLMQRVPTLIREHCGDTVVQTPYIIAEPITKAHVILLPRYATDADIATLKVDAFQAEADRDWDLAEQLWIRVNAAASGTDTQAIGAFQRIAVARMNSDHSAQKPLQRTNQLRAKVSPINMYRVKMVLPSAPVVVGSEFTFGIHIAPFMSSDSKGYLIEIPQDVALEGEVNIFLVAPGFWCDGSSADSFPLTHNIDFAIFDGQSGQTANFLLTALQSGMNTIRVEIFYDDVSQLILKHDIQVIQVDTSVIDKLVAARSRPVPQPDLILQIQTGWNETLSRCAFNYYLDSFHPRLTFASEIQQRSETFTAGWLRQAHKFLQNTLEEVSSSLAEDYCSRLTSLGRHFFQQLLPQELQATFRSVMHFNVPFTLLILADQYAEFPWELLHDGQSFFGDRFIIGCWPLELEKTRPYEFAIGAVTLAHYENVEQPEQWSGLLKPSGAPPPMALSGGVLADLGSVEAMRGLHLLRRGTSLEEIDRQDAPVPWESSGSEDLEQSLRPAKLSLRRNRPLVTLGYLSAGLPELTTLEQTWAPTFIRSGCSAFVGPLWAVQPAVETAFTSNFYNRLWAGESLGRAFQTGRHAAKAIAPDSLDWMAYVLYGDPMARPYRPTAGKGYAVVEPIGQEVTDPVAPGASVRFRVSLRRTPPVWYSDRLMDVAEDLTFEDLRVYIVASGLKITPGDSIDMQRSPSGDYLGWFTLTVPSNFEGNSALVRVHYEDGDDPVHSLRFALSVGDDEVERP